MRCASSSTSVECRTDDPVTVSQVRTLDHPPTRAAAIAERGFLAELGAGCSAPVGALAELTAEAADEPVMRLSGVIAAPDGSSVIRAQLNRCGQRQRHARPPASPDAAPRRGRCAARPLSILSADRDEERRQLSMTTPLVRRSTGGVPGAIASHSGIPASRNASARYTWHHERVSLRCLLVDDNDAFLRAASVLLQREGLTVVGVASNSAEALRQAGALRPDVILVDIGLGDESGFDLARLLAQDGQAGRAEVILISARAEADYAELIAESPAAGFLVKSELSAQAISRILSHTS